MDVRQPAVDRAVKRLAPKAVRRSTADKPRLVVRDRPQQDGDSVAERKRTVWRLKHVPADDVASTIRDLIATGDFKGKLNETAVLYPRGAIPAQRVLIVGLGKEEKFDLDKVRQAAGTAAKRLRDLGIKSFATIVHGAGAGGI